jgi:hypothetical protein
VLEGSWRKNASFANPTILVGLIEWANNPPKAY